jgi:hypothetical protein
MFLFPVIFFDKWVKLVFYIQDQSCTITTNLYRAEQKSYKTLVITSNHTNSSLHKREQFSPTIYTNYYPSTIKKCVTIICHTDQSPVPGTQTQQNTAEAIKKGNKVFNFKTEDIPEFAYEN